MKSGMTRRDMMRLTPAACGVAGLLGWDAWALGADDEPRAFATIEGTPREVPANYPRHPLDEVEATVRFAHFDLARVKKLVGRRPELAKASWDWGFGDWETPLGAASHTGQREIAEYLLKHGARPSIFTFAMLGSVEAVRGMIEARPGVQQVRGPHGITLLAHAKAGGADAADVVQYLEQLGDADPEPKSLEIPDQERKMIIGTYAYGTARDERLDVFERRGKLQIRRGDVAGRRLLRIGPFEYHPTGAPNVRVQFDKSTLPCRTVTVADRKLTVVASRVDDGA